MENIITPELVKHEAHKYFLAPALWIIFFSFIPFMYQNFYLIVTIALMIFPGSLLFSWICFLYHESWHKYVPSIPNEKLFIFYGWLLAHDPQVYRIVHGGHHIHTNTWNDIEFHPLGFIKNDTLRHIYNLGEILLGSSFIYIITFFVIKKNARFKWQSFIISALALIVIFGSFFAFSHYFLNVKSSNIIISWILMFIIGGTIQHHSQLIEHGNIILNESTPFHDRIMLTRNLYPVGWFEKIFLFLTHWHAQEHILHHTEVSTYTRPFLHTLPMPPDAIYITFKDYKKVLWEMITK